MSAHTCFRTGFTAAMILATTLVVGCKETNVYAPPPPPKVTVSKPYIHDAPLYMEQNGETEAVQRAEVRARVEGFLREIKFSAGDEVMGEGLEEHDKGQMEIESEISSQDSPDDASNAPTAKDDPAAPSTKTDVTTEPQDSSNATVLFVIERDRYEAEVQGAQARLAAADAAKLQGDAAIAASEAELARDEQEYLRQKTLLADNAAARATFEKAEATYKATKQQLEAAKAQKKVFEADVLKAKAELATANLNLHYTRVLAPIDGVVSKTDVKIGNLVEPGTLLTTVIGQNQMYANFNVNELDMQELRKTAREQGIARDRLAYKGFRVELKTGVDTGYPYVGKLDYIDERGIEQGTGTLLMRAVFPNREEDLPPKLPRLMPGSFVQVRLEIGHVSNAMLLPELAISKDQAGSYVMVVVNEGGKEIAQRRNVETGAKFNNLIIVRPLKPEITSDISDEVKGTGAADSEVLQPDDRVIIQGLQRARAGAEVNPTEGQFEIPDDIQNYVPKKRDP